MSTPVSNLRQRFYDINALQMAGAMMDWDHQCYMPEGAAEARAEHGSILSRMHHEMLVGDETRKLIDAAAADPSDSDWSAEEVSAFLRVAQRSYDLATKIPTDLVAKKSKLSALAHEKWVQARANNDFASFAPTLEQMFDIAREEAEHLGYTGHIYNALLDQYEEGATVDDCNRMYGALKGPNKALIDAIQASSVKPDDSKLYGSWDESKQRDFTLKIVSEIGFDMKRGRQDTAAHPFCTNFSMNDVRLTTRFKDYIGSAIFGSLHEAGHGMYEQGSPQKYDRTPLCGGVSLGIHESQSRTWENIVGRSKSFWKRYLPELQKAFPELSSFDLDTWYAAINKVNPSYIRVEADEVTYNMHTLVRFEIECEVLENKLAIKDAAEAWNAKYEAYLGIRPRNDGEGILQDVHWSAALIGYFPTYSMGNLLSYQIWNKLQADVGDTDALMEEGNFAPILTWLQEKVYSKGCVKMPRDLVMEVTGKPMGAEDYVEGLQKKYAEIYNL